MKNVATFLNYVATKDQDNQEKFVAIKSMQLAQNTSCKKCLQNSQLYHKIKCEEEREGCRDILKLCRDLVKTKEQKQCRNFLKLCHDKGQGK